jgi:GT2 family glycosyltransferase
MRVSLVIAAHNEGDFLWKTVQSCVETCAGLDYEIVIADDASWDGCVDETRKRFPQVRVVGHVERLGPSPTKDLGARHARGDVLVFLDGHTKPEPGAIRQLVESVESHRGGAVITPAITGLDVARWKPVSQQIGHGYFLELERFDCGWLPLGDLKQTTHRGRTFYESPAAIGCAFAVHRELYDDLRGFDPHMRSWGVEDLDFSLKCWLLGHPILHDPQAVVAHRFRRGFDNFDVPIQDLITNQLRMAYKNFTPGVWREWVDRCRRRHPGRLPEHPEGLWTCAWQLFEQRLPSAEQERAYLMFRRVRDEFWYAERFNLLWPRLQAEKFVPSPREFEALVMASASPSPAPCAITAVLTSGPVCVGADKTFFAQGSAVVQALWTALPGAFPATGTGPTFTTKWTATGLGRQVTASCNQTSATATVDVVGVDKIVVEGTSNEGPVTIKDGTSMLLRANRTPAPATGPWPAGSPKWDVTAWPGPFKNGRLEITPADPGLARFFPELDPNLMTGTYKVKATCGTSTDEFTVNVDRCSVSVTNVSADQGYEKVADTGHAFNVVGVKKGGEDRVTLTLTIDPDNGPNRDALTWEGAAVVSTDPADPAYKIKATVPINESVRQDVTVKFSGTACKEIRVWPIWATLVNRIAGSISANNNASMLVDGKYPSSVGGGNSLGPIDKEGTPSITYAYAIGRMEAKATLSPTGVGDVVPSDRWRLRRRVTAKAWDNAGHYVGATWVAGPSVDKTDENDTSPAFALDLNPQGNDELYDLDGPGCSTRLGTAIKHTSELYANFEEYAAVVLSGTEQECSQHVPWSYQARVDIDKAAGKVELNQLSTSHITIPSAAHYTKR